jgi:hypothetical protein
MANLILNHFFSHYLCFHTFELKIPAHFQYFSLKTFSKTFFKLNLNKYCYVHFYPQNLRHFKTPILKMISTWK